MALMQNQAGGYQFLPGSNAFSSGIVALPGFEVVRVHLRHPLPYQRGFDLIVRHLETQGRSRAALCAIELRTPKPFSFVAFTAFNQEYWQFLTDWHPPWAQQNPLARTNVVPGVRPPDEPVLLAFSYTVPGIDTSMPSTFIISGAGEVRNQTLAPANIVRYGEISIEALREKAAQVMYIMTTRLQKLNLSWAEAMAASVYTVHPLQPFLVSEILNVIDHASIHGVHWYYSRPPVEGLEFEMDIRSVRREIQLH
jgi:hypothetical protein